MITITIAVIVQTATVSMKGSKSDTIPSCTGYSLRAAEWAIAAEPMPASLEKAARLMPITRQPRKPPTAASGLKAPRTIAASAAGIAGAFVIST